MQNSSQLIVAILEVFPKDWGTITEIHQTDDPRFVLVFEDRPWNWGVRWAIAQGLSLFVRRRTLQLVCQDGAWGYIDTSALRLVPIQEDREKIALTSLQNLKLSPSEYCSVINPDKPFLLCGVEDKVLYERALKLWKSMRLESDRSTGLFRAKNQRRMNKFCELEYDRAIAIVNNLLQRMDTHELTVTGLTCCGNLPVLVCDILEFRNVSYAKIIPKETGVEDRDGYVHLSQGGQFILEELLSKVPSNLEWPTDGDWEKLRISQRYDIETKFEQGASVQQLFPEIYDLFTSPDFRRLSVEEKRQVVRESFVKFPFSILKQMIPEGELEEIFQAKVRYLGLEELLANQQFEQLPDFEEKIADLVTRVPEADLLKLQDSSIVMPGIKEAFSRHIEERKTRFAELVRQLSAAEFENDPEFEQKITKIIANLNQEQFGDLIQSPTVIAKVKQVLIKQILIPSLKHSVESQIPKTTKPGALGLGLLGLACGVIGIVFDFAATMKWYPFLITGLFFVETIYCFAIKRRRMAVSWLVFAFAFLGGYYSYETWGMVIGLSIAFIIAMVMRPDKDDEQMNNLILLRKMLVGTDEDQSRTNTK